MGRTGERRTVVALRLGKKTIKAIDTRAEAEGLMLPRGETNRSELIRIAIDYMLHTMPPGWRLAKEATMTTTPLNLDNLTAGLTFPPGSNPRTPAGTITAVERRPCDWHNPDGNDMGWLRDCPRCVVVRTERYETGEERRVALPNEYLWTDADRAEWERQCAAAAERRRLDDEPEPFDPLAY